MSRLFQYLLVKPLINALRWLYETVAFNDFGVAIILLTIGVRIVLFPLFYKSFIQQAKMRKIQPHIERIQRDHKHNREEQGRALLALYREHQVNPWISFLLLLVQLPILIALYQVFLNPPPGLTYTFLTLINLQEKSIIITVIAAAAQYILGRLSMPSSGADAAAQTARIMIIAGPLITVLVLYTLPAAVGLYWVATTIISIIQQWYVNKSLLYFHETSTGHTTSSSHDG